MRSSFRHRFASSTAGVIGVGLVAGLVLTLDGGNEGVGTVLTANAQTPAANAASAYTVLGYNELGMHCMNQNFAELCILLPFNNLRAQVIRRGEEPHIVTSGVSVRYSVPSNTSSATKTNFWQFAPKHFGKTLAPNVGLSGNGLAGAMKPTGFNDWIATGIPITPINNKGALDPYPLSKIDVLVGGRTVATTAAVVPVSWEISCNLCHNTPGITPDTDILRKHDKLHKTHLEKSKPVLCASCHADPALGTKGASGVKTLSAAMHGSHASRMAPVASLGNACYACHPGFKTHCQRDVHFTKGITCTKCHGNMMAVANPARQPWVTEPTCGGCHQKRKPTFAFEEPGKLFKDSRGHGGVHCAACHGPQHATGPTVTAADNVQAIQHQGVAGTIKDCKVCHTQKPDEPFFHSIGDDAEGERRRKAKAAKNSPLGSYSISGSEKLSVGNKVAVMNFKGSLVANNPTTVTINKLYANGEKGQSIVSLAGPLRSGLPVQAGPGLGKTGVLPTKAMLTFTKTPSGFAVTGTTSISDGSAGVPKSQEAVFKGAK